MAAKNEGLRIAAVADLHFSKTSEGSLQSLLAYVNERADLFALCGDLTDYGTVEEASLLARELSCLTIPTVAVLGNHDYEAGCVTELRHIMASVGVHVLDGDTFEYRNVGFAGVKGFAGGFGQRLLAPWGEETMKRFVHETIEEALKLESALAKLQTAQRVALLHYSPIRATVMGEPAEVFPFLGSSRLEEPLNRYPVAVAFHGHAHHGAFAGETSSGVPVFNVSLPLLRQTFPDRVPVHIVTVGPGGTVARQK
jgi:Icc-related predicted phosphoesterase